MVSVLDYQLIGRGSNPSQGRIWLDVSAPLAPPSLLSYDEYT